jgi:hypothetical protein
MTEPDQDSENSAPEQEDQTLLSEAIRHDLRHLMSHGHCRYEISRRLYELFKDAHGGMAPENMQYVVKDLDDDLDDDERWFVIGESVGGGILELTRWLDTPEGHAVTGWFSFGEWRGPQKKTDLAALQALELAAHEKRMAQLKRGHAKRLKLFESKGRKMK